MKMKNYFAGLAFAGALVGYGTYNSAFAKTVPEGECIHETANQDPKNIYQHPDCPTNPAKALETKSETKEENVAIDGKTDDYKPLNTSLEETKKQKNKLGSEIEKILADSGECNKINKYTVPPDKKGEYESTIIKCSMTWDNADKNEGYYPLFAINLENVCDADVIKNPSRFLSIITFGLYNRFSKDIVAVHSSHGDTIYIQSRNGDSSQIVKLLNEYGQYNQDRCADYNKFKQENMEEKK